MQRPRRHFPLGLMALQRLRTQSTFWGAIPPLSGGKSGVYLFFFIFIFILFLFFVLLTLGNCKEKLSAKFVLCALYTTKQSHWSIQAEF